jgi:hypothetical protein
LKKDLARRIVDFENRLDDLIRELFTFEDLKDLIRHFGAGMMIDRIESSLELALEEVKKA